MIKGQLGNRLANGRGRWTNSGAQRTDPTTPKLKETACKEKTFAGAGKFFFCFGTARPLFWQAKTNSKACSKPSAHPPRSRSIRIAQTSWLLSVFCAICWNDPHILVRAAPIHSGVTLLGKYCRESHRGKVCSHRSRCSSERLRQPGFCVRRLQPKTLSIDHAQPNRTESNRSRNTSAIPNLNTHDAMLFSSSLRGHLLLDSANYKCHASTQASASGCNPQNDKDTSGVNPPARSVSASAALQLTTDTSPTEF